MMEIKKIEKRAESFFLMRRYLLFKFSFKIHLKIQEKSHHPLKRNNRCWKQLKKRFSPVLMLKGTQERYLNINEM